jgi:putative sterol carrier protein
MIPFVMMMHDEQWDIKGDKGVEIWTMDLKAGNIAKGAAAKADCTIACSEEDFLGMISGKANSQAMFMQVYPRQHLPRQHTVLQTCALQGKLKIKGNMMLAMKLGELTKLTAGKV